MDERTIQPPAELPASLASRPTDELARPGPVAGPQPLGDVRPLDDPRALTVLTTEHWSLLSARGLVYNEAFARAGMFLTFLSATLVALGLVSAGLGFLKEFLLVAAGILAVDLFIGLATLGRVVASTAEDLRYLQGMNRLRHAYHELVPGLEPYFIAGKHDDITGVFAIYSAARPMTRGGALHALTTTAGMLAVITAAVGSVLAGVLLLLLTDAAAIAALGTLLVLVVGLAVGLIEQNRRFAAMGEAMDVRFPTPPG